MYERILFDSKYRPEIEVGKYRVVTRDGREVKISQWDRPDEDYPIVAHIKGEGGCFTYTDKGKYVKGDVIKNIDLFLVPNHDDKEPIAKPSVDWDAFRREAAKDILCALITSDMGGTAEEKSRWSIDAADKLIKQLKEG